MRRIRGKRIGAIFQDPLTSLNPLFTIGQQLVETIDTHLQTGRNAARRHAIDLLAEVGIPAPELRLDQYPHQLSGGMRQRVVIALALAGNPRLIVADEPTTALDVSIQAQIITLLKRLAAEHDTAVMLITHDMGVIAEMANRVVVMYAGRPVEIAPELELVRHPRHPYTWGLLDAVPRLNVAHERLRTIRGNAVSPLNLPPGCAFAPRCDYVMQKCAERPPLRGENDHVDACWLSDAQKVTIRRTPEHST